MWRKRMGVGAVILLVSTTGGCATRSLPAVGRDAPAEYVLRVDQFAFTTDFPLGRDDPLIADLLGLREHLGESLPLSPGSDPIRIVIFDSPERYHRFLADNYPSLPDRRAFFVKTAAGDSAIFACKGDRLREDLRHEVAHSLLHVALPNVPLWLDEGLALYFEAGPRRNGVDPRHLIRLRAELTADPPNLARLESISDLGEMSVRDYRESWLWVHYCLHHSDGTRTAFFEYLDDLDAAEVASFQDRLAAAEPNFADSVLEHLAGLAVAIGQPPLDAEGDGYRCNRRLSRLLTRFPRLF